MAFDQNTALTTVDDVRLALGLPTLTVDQTKLIQKQIMAASAAVARFLGRPLGFSASIDETVKGYGANGPRFQLRRWPIYSITSIGFPGAEVISVVDGDAIIEKEGSTGLVTLRHGLMPFTGYFGTGLVGDGAMADTEIAAEDLIRVVYAGGWKLPGQIGVPSDVVPLPADIQAAVEAAIVAGFNRTGRDMDVQSERLLSEQTVYVDVNSNTSKGALAGWPKTAASLIRGYRDIALY